MKKTDPVIPASVKANWLITGFLFGAFLSWCGAWLMITHING
jgi:hypothetical protein